MGCFPTGESGSRQAHTGKYRAARVRAALRLKRLGRVMSLTDSAPAIRRGIVRLARCRESFKAAASCWPLPVVLRVHWQDLSPVRVQRNLLLQAGSNSVALLLSCEVKVTKTLFRLKWNPTYVIKIHALSALPIPPETEFDSLQAAEQELQSCDTEAFLIEQFEKDVA